MVSLPATSPDARKSEFYGELVERSLRVLVEAIGDENLEAVLLIGAPARGEATVVETPDGLYSLSDIDLVCISAACADPVILRRRISSWRRHLVEEIGPRCAGVDVSIRSRDEISSLQALIATYEMLRSPAVLWGDPSILESLPILRLDEIPLSESLTLLHNRIVEELLLYKLVAAQDLDGPHALKVLYGTAKLALDAVTAVLYAERNVPERYRDRVEVFEGSVLAGDVVLKARLVDYVDDLVAWARFKSDGDLDRLGAGLSGRTDAPNQSDLARQMWRRYAAYAEVCWRDILGRLMGTEADGLGLAETVSLYAGLESALRSVARTWRLSRPGAAPDGLFSKRRLVKGAVFASPRQRAYLVAVITYLGLAGIADERIVDDLIRRYTPFRTRIGRPSIASDEGSGELLGSLALFHETLLLGREAGRH